MRVKSRRSDARQGEIVLSLLLGSPCQSHSSLPLLLSLCQSSARKSSAVLRQMVLHTLAICPQWSPVACTLYSQSCVSAQSVSHPIGHEANVTPTSSPSTHNIRACHENPAYPPFPCPRIIIVKRLRHCLLRFIHQSCSFVTPPVHYPGLITPPSLSAARLVKSMAWSKGVSGKRTECQSRLSLAPKPIPTRIQLFRRIPLGMKVNYAFRITTQATRIAASDDWRVPTCGQTGTSSPRPHNPFI